MAKCNNCGSPIPDGAAECSSCRAQLAPVAAVQSAVWPPPATSGYGVLAMDKPVMDPALVKKSNILVLTAIGMFLVGVGVCYAAGASHDSSLATVGLILLYASAVPWYWGLGAYAKAKGYSALLCLLGLLSIFGLLILLLLPVKQRAS